jgi:Pectinacetylesterase
MAFIKPNVGKLLLAVLVVLTPARTFMRAAEQSPAESGAAKHWQRMPGGKDTACSDGSAYSYFVHPGDRAHLLIYFQGGGACWSGQTCDPRSPLYRPNLSAVDPATEQGIFDFANAENPLRTYFVVFVPYCTGDVHLGNRAAKYLPDKPEIHHQGFNNAMSALRWTFANVASPQSILVAGGSAGAMASPFYAGRIADHYKAARLVQLGDSAGGIGGPAIPGMFDSWGTAEVAASFAPYRGIDLKTADLATLYLREGLANKSITFAQFNHTEDNVQEFGLQMFGIKSPLSEVLEKNYAQIRSQIPRFHTFTAPGTLHVILNRPEFYTVNVGGRRLRDWVAELAGGKAPADVPVSKSK